MSFEKCWESKTEESGFGTPKSEKSLSITEFELYKKPYVKCFEKARNRTNIKDEYHSNLLESLYQVYKVMFNEFSVRRIDTLGKAFMILYKLHCEHTSMK